MIYVNAENRRKVIRQLGSFEKKAPTVIARAINRAAESAKTAAVSKAKEEYEIKAGEVRDTIKITKASERTLGAKVVSKGRKLPLIHFKVSPKEPRHHNPPRVLRVAVKRDGLKPYIGAFVARGIASGRLAVMKRATKDRYPIHRKYGPAIPQMIGNESIRTFVEKEALKTMDKRIEHEIQNALEGRL